MKKTEEIAQPEKIHSFSNMKHLKIYNKQDILSLTKIRRFETKLGERLQIVNDAGDIAKSLAASKAKYVFPMFLFQFLTKKR